MLWILQSIQDLFSARQVLSAKAKFTVLESNWEGNPVTELPAGVFCGIFNEVQLSEGIAILYYLGGE